MRELPVNKVVVVPKVTDETLELLPYLNRAVIAILVLRRQDAGRVDCRLAIHLERADIPRKKIDRRMQIDLLVVLGKDEEADRYGSRGWRGLIV